MNAGRTIFSQLMSFLPQKEFQKCVARYRGERKTISFSAFDRIKAFYGASENAVRMQVWTAISAYLLLAIVRKRLELPYELHAVTQLLRLHLFAKTPILSLFSEPPEKIENPRPCNQLSLFE